MRFQNRFRCEEIIKREMFALKLCALSNVADPCSYRREWIDVVNKTASLLFISYHMKHELWPLNVT